MLNHPIFFLENVANITDHNDGKTFNIIHNELSERGYFIRYAIMDACRYGIPQHRTRMYLIAFKNERDCNAFLFPLGQDCEKIFLIALIGRISRMKNSTLRKAQRHTCS